MDTNALLDSLNVPEGFSRLKGGYWGRAAEDNVGPDHTHGAKGRPADWSGFNPYIFCPKTSFGPEKIIPPRAPTPHLVRIFDRTFPCGASLKPAPPEAPDVV